MGERKREVAREREKERDRKRETETETERVIYKQFKSPQYLGYGSMSVKNMPPVLTRVFARRYLAKMGVAQH